MAQDSMEQDVEKTGHVAQDTDSGRSLTLADGAQMGDEKQAAHDAFGSKQQEAGEQHAATGESKSADDDDDDRPQRSTRQITMIMIALALACFLAALDITIVTTALPTITEYFHSETAYTWVGSAYLLAVASTTIIWGKLSDVFGRKPMLLTANAVFFVGSLISALAVNVTMLLFGRAIQGVGGGGLNLLVNVCIGDLFSPRRRGAFYGVTGGVWALALSLGPIIGGAFTERVSWRWCFYINLPLDGIAFVIILLYLDLKTPKTPFLTGIQSIDWVGAALSIGGTLMFLFGISFGGDRDPWDSAIVICLIVFGVVTWGVFFVYEAYIAKYPLMPPFIFKQRSSMVLLGLCFFQSLVYFASSYYLPLYFQAVLGASPILSGVYLIPLAVALSVASVGSGQYLRRTGSYQYPIWMGFLVMTIGYGLFIDLGPNANWALIILSQIVAGFGAGPNFQAPMIALQSLVPPRYIASATSGFAYVRMLSGAVSVVIGQVVFQNEASKRQPQLAAAVGPALAQTLGGGAAGSNTDTIRALPASQREVVHEVLASSLKYIWIMYTAFSAAGFLLSLAIRKATLTDEHKETKTGLAAEQEARQERMVLEQAKRNSGNDIDAKA